MRSFLKSLFCKEKAPGLATDPAPPVDQDLVREFRRLQSLAASGTRLVAPEARAKLRELQNTRLQKELRA